MASRWKLSGSASDLLSRGLVDLVEERLLGVEELALDEQVCCGDFLAYDMGGLFLRPPFLR